MKTFEVQYYYLPHLLRPGEEQRIYEEVRYRLARKIADALVVDDSIFRVFEGTRQSGEYELRASVTLMEQRDISPKPKYAPTIKLDKIWVDELCSIDPAVLDKIITRNVKP